MGSTELVVAYGVFLAPNMTRAQFATNSTILPRKILPKLPARLDTSVGRVLIPYGEHLRCVVNEYMAHYHTERNHQGLGNRLIETTTLASRADGPVVSRTRVGGMLKYYYRSAA